MNWLKAIGDFFANLFKFKEVKVEPLPKVNTPVKPTPETSTVSILQGALSWELPCNDAQAYQGAHPERRVWSESLYNWISVYWDEVSQAKDIRTLVPLDSLSRSQAITIFAELMSCVAKYESTWNPNCVAKDVNGSSLPKNQARGFFQMNEGDQSAYQTYTKYSWTQLNDPFINIEVGIKILVTVLRIRGKITFSKNEKSSVLSYFYATLLTDGAVGPKVFKDFEVQKARLLKEFGKTVFKETHDETPWMLIAEKEKGVTEVPGIKNNPRVLEYHASTSLKAKDDETSWCSAFASWVLQQAGYKSPKTAWARDFENYGTKLTSPKYGCLMGFERNAPGGDSHISFYVSEDDIYYYVLGGNQDNQVKVKGYPKSSMIYMRWPVKAGV
jgi:uncharacterized protein (TIGR02594 family)